MRTQLNKQQVSEIHRSITLLQDIYNQEVFDNQDNDHLFEASEHISKAINELYEELRENENEG